VVHGLTDATVMFVPGEPTEGDAVNVSRLGGRRVVVVVLDGFDDVLVTARVVEVDACVVLVVGAVVVCACAAQLHIRATTTPSRAPSTS
jgi:hypothetical protein